MSVKCVLIKTSSVYCEEHITKSSINRDHLFQIPCKNVTDVYRPKGPGVFKFLEEISDITWKKHEDYLKSMKTFLYEREKKSVTRAKSSKRYSLFRL